MKRLIFTISIIFIVIFNGNSQTQPLRINTLVLPPYSHQVESYFIYDDRVTIIVENTDETKDIKFKFLISIEGTTNGVEIFTYPDYIIEAPIEIAAGETLEFTGNELLDYGLQLTESEVFFEPETLIDTRTLPEGNYELCITAVDFVDFNVVLSDPLFVECGNFYVEDLNPPLIITPDDLYVLDDGESDILFSWVSFITNPDLQERVNYNLRMIDLTLYGEEGGSDNPEEALNDGLAVFEVNEDITEDLSFIAEDLLLNPTHQYAVQVTASDPEAEYIFRNEGRSEVLIIEPSRRTPANPAHIYEPINFANIPESTSPTIAWNLPNLEGEVFEDASHILYLVDVQRVGVNSIESLEQIINLINTSDVPISINLDSGLSDWSIDELGEVSDETAELISGRKYCAILQSLYPEGPGFTNDGYSNFVNFTYGEEATSPELIRPYEDQILTLAENPQFNWELPELNGESPDDIMTTLAVIDLTELGLADLLNQNEFNSHLGTEMVIGLTASVNEYSIGDDFTMSSRPIEFITGHRYAAIVRCTSSSVPNIANNGYSNVVNFSYYGTATAPVLTIPENFGNITTSSSPQFEWDYPLINGAQIPGLSTSLIVLNLGEIGRNSLDNWEDFESFTRLSSPMEVFFNSDINNFTIGDELTIDPSFPIELINGRKYAAAILCTTSDGVPISNNGYSNIVNFTFGEEATAPVFLTPDDGSTLGTDDRPQFSWTIPQLGGTGLTDVRSSLAILNLDELGIESISDHQTFTDYAGREMVVGLERSINEYNWNSDARESSNPIILESGTRYAAVVRCTSLEHNAIANNGYTNVVNFTYGSKATAPYLELPENYANVGEYNNPQFRWVHPTLNEESLANIRTRLIIVDLSLVGLNSIYNLEEFNEAISDIDNQMVAGIDPGITTYKVGDAIAEREGGEIELISGRKYAAAILCESEDGIQIENFGYSNIVNFTYGNEASAPILEVPENGSILAEDASPQFRWTIPSLDEEILEDTKSTLAVIDLKAAGLETLNTFEEFAAQSSEMAVGLSDAINYYSLEQEEGVRLSSNPIVLERGRRYAAVIRCTSESYNAIANNGYSNVVTFDYVERSEVDLPEESAGSEENDPTDCSTACMLSAPTGSAVTSHEDRESFKMGYFAVKELDLESSTGTKLKGTGVIEIPFLFNAKIKVDFDNIELNGEGRAMRGTVLAHQDPVPFTSDLDSEAESGIRDSEEGGKLLNYLAENLTEGRVVSSFVADVPIGMPIGFDRRIEDQNLLIGITGMTFTPTGATIKLQYEHHFQELGIDRWISLRGDACMKPSGLDAQVLLALNRDFVIAQEEDEQAVTRMVFKGSNSSDLDEVRTNATHIEFQCACVKSFGVQIEAYLDEEKYIKDYDTTPVPGPVGVRFGIHLNKELDCNPSAELAIPREYYSKNNFMMKLDMDPFQHVDLGGWGFHVNDAVIDMSTVENHADMVFPAIYDHAATNPPDGATTAQKNQLKNIWTGFYLKELSVKAPPEFYDSTKVRRLKTGLRNVLIDETGFTLELFLQNIISVGEGSADGWSFALDEANIKLVQNTFRSGSLKGKLGLPVMKEDENMEWSAILYHHPDVVVEEEGMPEKRKWGFLMAIEPEGTYEFPALMATANVSKSSFVAFRRGYVPDGATGLPEGTGTSENISFNLSGKISIAGGQADPDDSESEVSLETSIGFMDMDFRLAFHKELGFHDYHFGLASPQKMLGAFASSNSLEGDGDSGGSMGGFPVSIKEFKINSRFDEAEDLCIGADIKITPEINLMSSDEGGFKASTTISIPFDYNFDNKRFDIGDPSIDCISIGIAKGSGGAEGSEQNGITLEGNVCFYKDEARCDTENASGMRGNLKVGLPIADVTLAAEFGSTDEFRYWFVDGKVVFEEGITIGALQLKGLGGGFYYNMAPQSIGFHDPAKDGYNAALVNTASEMQSAPANHNEESIPKDPEERNELSIAASDFNPCPERGTKVLKFVLPLAAAGDEKVFNMDVTASLDLSPGRGAMQFELIGDGYVMTEIKKRNKAPVKLDVKIQYAKTPEFKRFSAAIDSYLDYNIKNMVSIKGAGKPVAAFNGQILPPLVKLRFLVEKQADAEGCDWYFKIGEPRDTGLGGPAGLKILLGNADKGEQIEFAELGSYFQMGNHEISRDFMELPELLNEIFSIAATSGEESGLGEGNDTASSEGDRPDERRYSDAAQPDRSAGFAMGLKFSSDLDIDGFLVYAKLAFAVGFDVNLLNTAANSCTTTSGEFIEDYGFQGFYAKGRFFAAVDGALGLQLRLIKVRRLELFRLAAAFIIEGGFPNPTWAEGQAAIYFNLLGGLINGTANVQFKLGDKCRLPKTDPFGFPLIQEIKPEDGYEDVSPYVSPNVSFVTRMGRELALPIIDIDGEPAGVEYLTPLIHNIGLTHRPLSEASNPDFRSTGSSAVDLIWKEDDRLLVIDPQEELPEKEVTLKISLRAMERIPQDNGTHLFKEAHWPAETGNSGVWQMDTLVSFKTAPLPDQIEDSQYVYSTPIRGQKYFLQDATSSHQAQIIFKGNKLSTYFYSEKEGLEYRYKVLLYPYDASSALTADVTASFSNGKTLVRFEMPKLENNMIYKLILAREQIGGFEMQIFNFAGLTGSETERDSTAEETMDPGIDQGLTDSKISVGNLSTGYDLGLVDLGEVALSQDDYYTRYQVMATLGRIQPGSWNESGNLLRLFSFSFKTSAFDNLEDKLESATAQHSTGLSAKLYADEGFDELDIKPYFSELSEATTLTYPPLVGLFYDTDNNYFNNNIADRYDEILEMYQQLEELHFYGENNRRHRYWIFDRYHYFDFKSLALTLGEGSRTPNFTIEGAVGTTTDCDWEFPGSSTAIPFRKTVKLNNYFTKKSRLKLSFGGYNFRSIRSNNLYVKNVYGYEDILDEDDLESAWQETLESLAREIESSSSSSSISLAGTSGISGLGFSSLIPRSGLSSAAIETIVREKLRFSFVPTQEILWDFQNFLSDYDYYRYYEVAPTFLIKVMDESSEWLCQEYAVIKDPEVNLGYAFAKYILNECPAASYFTNTRYEGGISTSRTELFGISKIFTPVSGNYKIRLKNVLSIDPEGGYVNDRGRTIEFPVR